MAPLRPSDCLSAESRQKIINSVKNDSYVSGAGRKKPKKRKIKKKKKYEYDFLKKEKEGSSSSSSPLPPNYFETNEAAWQNNFPLLNCLQSDKTSDNQRSALIDSLTTSQLGGIRHILHEFSENSARKTAWSPKEKKILKRHWPRIKRLTKTDRPYMFKRDLAGGNFLKTILPVITKVAIPLGKKLLKGFLGLFKN